MLFKVLTTPIVWVLLLLLTGLSLLREVRKQSRFKLGWYLLVIGFSILFFLSLKPVSNFLVYPLEYQYQFPSSELLSNIDMIVILGGGVIPALGQHKDLKNAQASGATYSRLFNGVRIFKNSNAKMLMLSGAGEVSGSESNAEVMKRLAMELGIPEDKIITEVNSRNTYEHAIWFKKIFPNIENMKIGIVTSALHMPRTVQAFKNKISQDAIIPIPVDYIYSPLQYTIEIFIPSINTFVKSSYAIHEWIGIIWYYLRGYWKPNISVLD